MGIFHERIGIKSCLRRFVRFTNQQMHGTQTNTLSNLLQRLCDPIPQKNLVFEILFSNCKQALGSLIMYWSSIGWLIIFSQSVSQSVRRTDFAMLQAGGHTIGIAGVVPRENIRLKNLHLYSRYS